jgi:translation initiation factor eIF-2B subunit delta
MSFSMGNAVRWLKLLISNLDVDLHDEDAKLLLCNAIDLFILNRIREPGSEIAKRAANMVTDGSTIVTYGCHHLVERTILYTKSRGLRCNVVIIDDPYERRGRSLAKRLRAEGLDVTYCSDLSATIRWLRTSTVLLGAEAIFSNGALYAQTGTGDLAAAAAEADARIITLCEIVNFTERVALDSLTYNEVSPEQSTESGFRLLFDSTMPELTGDLVTENGVTGTALIPRLLRKLEDIGYGSFK